MIINTLWHIVSLPPNHPFGTIEFVNGNVSIQEKQIELEQNNAIICGDSTIGLYQTLLELYNGWLYHEDKLPSENDFIIIDKFRILRQSFDGHHNF